MILVLLLSSPCINMAAIAFNNNISCSVLLGFSLAASFSEWGRLFYKLTSLKISLKWKSISNFNDNLQLECRFYFLSLINKQGSVLLPVHDLLQLLLYKMATCIRVRVGYKKISKQGLCDMFYVVYRKFSAKTLPWLVNNIFNGSLKSLLDSIQLYAV